MESDFLDTYGWLHLAADEVASNSLLGRMRREFLRKQPPQQRRRRKCPSTRAFLSTRMTIHWKNVRRRVCWSFSSSSACSVCLGLSQASTRSNGTANRSGTHCGANGRIHLCPQEPLSRLATVVHGTTNCTVGTDFRVIAVELARTPRGQVPWSLALLRAQKELENKWDQRRDFLTLRRVNRTLKGDGRGHGFWTRYRWEGLPWPRRRREG